MPARILRQWKISARKQDQTNKENKMGNITSRNRPEKSNTTQDTHQEYHSTQPTRDHQQKQSDRINQPKQRSHSAPITQTQPAEVSSKGNTASFAVKIQRDHQADKQKKADLKKERNEARSGKYDLIS